MESQDRHWQGPGTWGLMTSEKREGQEPGFPKLLKCLVIGIVHWDNGGGQSSATPAHLLLFLHLSVSLQPLGSRTVNGETL